MNEQFVRLTMHETPSVWWTLTAFSIYRFFLTGVLFFVFYLKLPPDFLGSVDPGFYFNVSLIYFLIALVIMVLMLKRWGFADTQINVQLLIDIIALTMLIYASGGLKTGLGSLLLVVVLVGAAIVPGRRAAFFAAAATFVILLQVSYSHITTEDATQYGQAGLLGLTFFIVAWLAQSLSKKMLTSQVLAEKRARDVANLAVLNQHIISRLQIGVLAVDAHGDVTLFNESARHLLGIVSTSPGFKLKQVLPVLAEQVWLWQHYNAQPFKQFQARPYLPDVRASATKLDSGEILIYIENTSALAQQAQQLKLASLGRLTASIAHEIRNPLAAISHAGELLAEQQSENKSIQKLTGIIQRHSRRMNNIIDTILHMSRRKMVEPMMVVLATWLDRFITEFREIKSADQWAIRLIIGSPLARVSMDPEQLHQVMWNLLENAWQYSDPNNVQPRVEVRLSKFEDEIVVDVIDNGPGISPAVEQHLFEPFYSRRRGGTGLGLYLARELCQANGARLSFLPDKVQSSRFRISFPRERQEYLT